jgi:hypothetical protein
MPLLLQSAGHTRHCQTNLDAPEIFSGTRQGNSGGDYLCRAASKRPGARAAAHH